MVVLPIVMLLSIFAAYLPALYSRFDFAKYNEEPHHHPEDLAVAMDKSDTTHCVHKVVSIISVPKRLETIEGIPGGSNEVGLGDYKPSAGNYQMGDDPRGDSKRQSRSSWRSWMGGNVGVAV